MKTVKKDFTLRAYGHISVWPVQGPGSFGVDEQHVARVIRKIIRYSPWLETSTGEAKPARVEVWNPKHTGPGDYIIQVHRKLKPTQLYAFHLFLHGVIRSLVDENIPNVAYVSGHIELAGKQISMGY